MVGGLLAILIMTLPTCSDQPKDDPSPVITSSHQPEAFDGELRCQAGEEDGAVTWDYGANPKGRIQDPVRWFREHALGLDPELILSLVEEFRGSADTLDDVVLAKNQDGLVVAFIEFGRDDKGRYFPNSAVACTSSGLQEFT